MFVNYSYHNNKQPLTPKLVVPMNESPEMPQGIHCCCHYLLLVGSDPLNTGDRLFSCIPYGDFFNLLTTF